MVTNVSKSVQIPFMVTLQLTCVKIVIKAVLYVQLPTITHAQHVEM